MFRFVWIVFTSYLSTLVRRRLRGPTRPTWSLGFEAIVSALRRDWDETSEWELARVRSDIDARPYPIDMVKKVETRDGELGGVRARWFVPERALERAAVLYFHGGSYIYGSAWTTHADLMARLALASGVTVVGIDYRLAPEHPYPAALEEAQRALAALRSTVARVVVAGDSAGGNLAIELQLALRDRGETQADGAVLVSPWSDLTMPGASFRDNDAYDFGTRAVLVRHAKAFAGSIPLDDPRLSPRRAELAGLAPVIVTVGEVEIPRDDILALADALERAGVRVTTHVAPDMPHNAPMFAAYHPSGREALEAIARFVCERLA